MPIINQRTRKRLLLNGELATTLVKAYDIPSTDLYWYVGISSYDATKYVYQHIGEEILIHIRNGRIKLLLAMEFESFPIVIESIYNDIVIGLCIPAEHIALVIASKDAVTKVNEVAKTFNQRPIKTFWYNYFEHSMRDYHVTVDHTKPKLKKFLNLNRRTHIDRVHRFLFVGLVETRGLLDKGYVSFQNDIAWSDVWYHFNDLIPDDHKDHLESLGSLFVDTTDLSVNYNYPTESTIPFYESSYFSVVSETYFFNNNDNRFFSEKTFKPIMHKHPFLLISSPNMLELLKEIGYKTFSPFFDESYDSELDPYKRMTLIVNEVERLCNLSDDEWVELSKQLNDICEYNYKVFMDKKDIGDFIIPLN